jgi:hypothetical protein
MTDLYDIPFDMRTAEMVRAHYHKQFPILRMHDALVRKHNSRPSSVNEPWTGGFSTTQIAEMALAAIGRPARDHEDVLMAEQYIQHLRDEIATLYPQKDPDLAEAVICAEYQWAGYVMPAEEFEAMSPEQQRDHVDGLVEDMPGDPQDHLREALLVALPVIYRKITAEDAARRGKRNAVATNVTAGQDRRLSVVDGERDA